MARTPKSIKQEYAKTRGGWSRWIHPDMKQYFIGCCDCDLVHEMQFRVLKVVGRKGFVREVELTKRGEFVVEFRARRKDNLKGLRVRK